MKPLCDLLENWHRRVSQALQLHVKFFFLRKINSEDSLACEQSKDVCVFALEQKSFQKMSKRSFLSSSCRFLHQSDISCSRNSKNKLGVERLNWLKTCQSEKISAFCRLKLSSFNKHKISFCVSFSFLTPPQTRIQLFNKQITIKFHIGVQQIFARLAGDSM